MSALILLNGPPASGKSTMAELLVARRALALNLDIDLVRRQLGRWSDRPNDAGLAARVLALSMADTHLAAGLDVVVPQFLARTDFVERLDALAADHGASFHEIVLQLSREDAAEAFTTRRQRSSAPVHADAALLVDRSASDDPLGEYYDGLQAVLARRPRAVSLPVQPGEVGETFDRLLALLADNGLRW